MWQNEMLTSLQTPQQYSGLDSTFFGKRRRFDFAMQPDQGFVGGPGHELYLMSDSTSAASAIPGLMQQQVRGAAYQHQHAGIDVAPQQDCEHHHCNRNGLYIIDLQPPNHVRPRDHQPHPYRHPTALNPTS